MRALGKFNNHTRDQTDTSSEPLPASLQELVHELQVHQMELELQNEELRASHLALDCARARYFDLYDLAPVGYVTVGTSGLVLEARALCRT